MANTLGYVNKNLDLHYIELDTFEACITLPEDLIFVSLREGTDHVFDPLSKFPFSNIERDIIGLKGSFDMSFVKQSDFRKANSTFCPFVEPPHQIPLVLDNWAGSSLYWNYPFPVEVWCRELQLSVFERLDNALHENYCYVGNSPEYAFKLKDPITGIFSNEVQMSMGS